MDTKKTALFQLLCDMHLVMTPTEYAIKGLDEYQVDAMRSTILAMLSQRREMHAAQEQTIHMMMRLKIECVPDHALEVEQPQVEVRYGMTFE